MSQKKKVARGDCCTKRFLPGITRTLLHWAGTEPRLWGGGTGSRPDRHQPWLVVQPQLASREKASGGLLSIIVWQGQGAAQPSSNECAAPQWWMALEGLELYHTTLMCRPLLPGSQRSGCKMFQNLLPLKISMTPVQSSPTAACCLFIYV